MELGMATFPFLREGSGSLRTGDPRTPGPHLGYRGASLMVFCRL